MEEFYKPPEELLELNRPDLYMLQTLLEKLGRLTVPLGPPDKKVGR